MNREVMVGSATVGVHMLNKMHLASCVFFLAQQTISHAAHFKGEEKKKEEKT